MGDFNRLTIYCTTFPSKKNSKNAVYLKNKRRVVVLSSNEYATWERNTVIQIKSWMVEQVKAKGSIFPLTSCAISLIFYFPNKRRRDLTNASEGVMDSLVKCGVLSDDNWLVMNPIKLRGRLSTTKPRIEIYLSDPEPDEYSR